MKKVINFIVFSYALIVSGVHAEMLSLQLDLVTSTDRLLSGSFSSSAASLDADMKGFQINNPGNIVKVYPDSSGTGGKYAGFNLSGNVSVVKLVGKKHGATIEIPIELVAFEATSSADGNDGSAVINGTCHGSELSHLLSPGVFKSIAKPVAQSFCTTSSHSFLFQNQVTPFQVHSANYKWKIKDGKDFSKIFNEKYYPADIYSGISVIQVTEVYITDSVTGNKGTFFNEVSLSITWDNKPYINHVTSSMQLLNLSYSIYGGTNYVADGRMYISVGGALGRSLKITPRSQTNNIGTMKPSTGAYAPIPYVLKITSLNNGEHFTLIDGVNNKTAVAEFNTISIDDSLNMGFVIDVSLNTHLNLSGRVVFTDDIILVFETNEVL